MLKKQGMPCFFGAQKYILFMLYKFLVSFL